MYESFVTDDDDDVTPNHDDAVRSHRASSKLADVGQTSDQISGFQQQTDFLLPMDPFTMAEPDPLNSEWLL